MSALQDPLYLGLVAQQVVVELHFRAGAVSAPCVHTSPERHLAPECLRTLPPGHLEIHTELKSESYQGKETPLAPYEPDGPDLQLFSFF